MTRNFIKLSLLTKTVWEVQKKQKINRKKNKIKCEIYEILNEIKFHVSILNFFD